MTKHTPGPWIKRYNDRVTPADDTDGSKSIAHCYGGMHDCEANARLIAAAPDLLEACKAVLPGLSAGFTPRLKGLVQAAIAKAEGAGQ